MFNDFEVYSPCQDFYCILYSGAVKTLGSRVSRDNMSEYWLISAPVDKSNQQIWERMNTVTEKANLSNNFKFPIPELKVVSDATRKPTRNNLFSDDILAESLGIEDSIF